MELYIKFSVFSYKNNKYIVQFQFKIFFRIFVVLTNFTKNLKNKLWIFKYFLYIYTKTIYENDTVFNFQIFLNKLTFMEIKLK